ncbi:hypothetical protein B1H18_19295 [Streptomyces tsukubensis]|uniref:Peptidase n=1 Tax=Streptomyces tsukubensis TaxID=83656 RepID=A0A1V4A6E0_9ACTN|nr:hypothetical protein B1H18_19295 [Streptomyces tsukubensis]
MEGVQSRTSQDIEQVPAREEEDPGLSAELAATAAGARRRAVRDGDALIDTAHLLHSLLEADPRARGLFEGAQVAKLLGYLVQRSIGYGLQWHGTVEDSGGVPVVREAGWSPAATTAMAAALRRAERRGEGRATGLDLLAALAADSECRASEVLRHTGGDPARLLRTLAVRALEDAEDRDGGSPYGPDRDGDSSPYRVGARPERLSTDGAIGASEDARRGPALPGSGERRDTSGEFARAIDVSALRQGHQG